MAAASKPAPASIDTIVAEMRKVFPDGSVFVSISAEGQIRCEHAAAPASVTGK